MLSNLLVYGPHQVASAASSVRSGAIPDDLMLLLMLSAIGMIVFTVAGILDLQKWWDDERARKKRNQK